MVDSSQSQWSKVAMKIIYTMDLSIDRKIVVRLLWVALPFKRMKMIVLVRKHFIQKIKTSASIVETVKLKLPIMLLKRVFLLNSK